MTVSPLRGRTGRLPGLDVLRGFAILLVLIRHGFPMVAGSAGIVGVVVFVALSGYLITGVLLRDLNSTGRVSYGHFYRNRALRLLATISAATLSLWAIERPVLALKPRLDARAAAARRPAEIS